MKPSRRAGRAHCLRPWRNPQCLCGAIGFRCSSSPASGSGSRSTRRTADEPLPAEYKPDHPVATALRRLWVSPRSYPDFAWGWLTLLAAGSVLGTLSDRSGRRKPFIIGSAAVMALAAGVVLGLMNSYPALFALAGFVTIMAAWTVSRVRSVS